MDNFTFHNPTKIIFGKATENKVGTVKNTAIKSYFVMAVVVLKTDYMTE